MGCHLRQPEMSLSLEPSASCKSIEKMGGRCLGCVPRWDFYFDSISQIVMDSWTRGRVTLVGDAGYSPGPAVGGGTSIAMIGAYVLAQELAKAAPDHQAGLRAYEDGMRELAAKARGIGPSTMSTLIPRTGFQVRLIPELLRLVTRLPPRAQQRLFQLQATPARALDSIHLTRSTERD